MSGPAESIVGYRAKKNSLPIDLTKVGALRWEDYWEPVHPEARRAHRARARGLLPAAVGRGGEHPALVRRRDARLRPHGRRAPHPLRRASSTPASATRLRRRRRTAAARRSRCARATCRSWSSTASRSASSRSSAWPKSPTCSTARTSAPTTRASRRCSASTSPSRPRGAEPTLRDRRDGRAGVRAQPAASRHARLFMIAVGGHQSRMLASDRAVPDFRRSPKDSEREPRADAQTTTPPSRRRRRTSPRGRSRACASRATRSRSSAAWRSSAASRPRARCSASPTSPTSSA